MDTNLQKSFEALPLYYRELFEERAAIRQFEAGQSKDLAEINAYREISRLMKEDAKTRRL